MQEDSSNTTDQNQTADQVAKQIADLKATPPAGGSQMPGQQFTPNPAAADPVVDDSFEAMPEPPVVKADPPKPVDSDAPKPYNPPAADDMGGATEPEARTDESPDYSKMPDPPKSADSELEEPVTEDKKPATSAKDLPAELADIKKQALKELEPLVDKLELAPEKRYNILMEIIQSDDRKELLDKALDAAKTIADDNLRAQALMEVLNEVDYFGQK